MNDQDLPENGANPMNLAPAAEAPGNEPVDELRPIAAAAAALDVMDDDEVLEEDFAIDEDYEDDDDMTEVMEDIEVEDEDDDAERPLSESMFDEDDLFPEELSDLDVLTLEEAAIYLKVEYGAIRRLLKEQGLPGRKIGDEWRFLRGAIADWLRAPGGTPAPAAAPERVERSERPAQPERFEQRPQREERREFRQRPPLRERFAQESTGGGQRYPQQGGSRYPQQGGGSRYPQQGGPPRKRPPFRSEGQYEGNNQTGGPPGQGGGGQGGYPPPRRQRFRDDQQGQQFPQGEYRPPRKRPFREQQEGGGNFGGQAGGNFQGGGGGGGRRFGGPKKPKRQALNQQRFKRLDRRRFGGDSGQGGQPDAGE